jgi:hypothetical protein
MPISDPGELPEAGTAADGDVAMTERRYTEAAKLFGEAANYVPRGHASEAAIFCVRPTLSTGKATNAGTTMR